MKKALALTLLFACILCGCGKTEPKPPYFKNLSWGTSIESIKKIEPAYEEELNGNETVLICDKSSDSKDASDNPFPFEPDMVKYTFEDNYLKRMDLLGFIESESCLDLLEWIEEHFDSRGELKEGVFLYLSKEAPFTALTIDFPLIDVPRTINGVSAEYSYVRISLFEYNPN